MLRVRLPAQRAGWVRASNRRARLTMLSLLTLGRGGELPASQSRRAQDRTHGNEGRLEQWFAQYQLPLLDYLYGMTRDHEWAADLVQEVFLRAMTSSNDPAAVANPRAWLYRIATNTALTALRRRKRFTWLPLTVVEPQVGASISDNWTRPELPELTSQDFAVNVVERDAVWKTLAELPPRWRSVLLLQATGGFEIREIAAQLGLSEANVRKILFRAKERFRELHAQHEANDRSSPANGGPQ